MSGFLLPSVSPIDQPEGVLDERAVWEAIDPWLAQYSLIDYAQQTHIHAVVYAAAKKMGRLPTSEELAYHFHFWGQRLGKNPNTTLRWDDPTRITYPTDDAMAVPIFPFKKIGLPRLGVPVPAATAMDVLVRNFSDVVAEFARVRAEIEGVLAEQSLFIATNHSTWLNFPIIARALTRALGIPPERIYTILGPALTTYEQGFRAPLALSSLVKTVPETANGNMPGYESLVTAIRSRFARALKTICDQPGNVILFAPAGTRDVYDAADGSIGIKKPSPASLRLPDLRGCPVLPIGTNDRELMTVRESVQRGREFLRIGEVNHAPSKTGAEIMSALAPLIVDAAGRSIGKLLDTPA